ncbi:MAG: phosphate ABC transporter substrate-binding protein PstS [Gemmatimonadaceae bacterium]|nr:phosphate ABC transporter substrate-binding protein PstS [Gemmatimonadaceae bacterium]
MRLLRNCLGVTALLLGACATSQEAAGRIDSVGESPAGSTRVDLTGAGATFPYPIYARWFNEYAQRTNVRINYLSIGSGGGIRQVMDGTVDFGATDAPMTDEELARSSTPIMHIPTVMGAVAVTYNLPGLARHPLNLSGDVLADIFLGRITTWNDGRIRALNPDAPLPADTVQVVHRSDESGTSYIFSEYLAAVSPRWLAGPGRGRDVRWPVGIGGRGNEGVAGQVKQTAGSIGYLEVVYARQNRLPVARVRNRSGRFIAPMAFEIASAAAGVMSLAGPRSDLRWSLVNAPGDQSYPIASFTWMLISPQRIGTEKSRQLADFLRWALTDGGDVAASLGYVALPTVTATRVLELLNTLGATPANRP